MGKISIVIISDDTNEYLDILFRSFLNEIRNDTNFEVIFIDNFSTDGSIEKARRYGIEKIFSFNEKVASRAVLYNKGMEMSCGENILFIHSDIYFDSDFFNKLKESTLLNDDTNGFINFAQYNFEGYFTDHEQISLDYANIRMYHKELYQFVPPSSNIVYIISEACFMVRKEIAEKILFNENYKRAYFDYELLDRLLRNGYKLINITECKFVHYFIELHEKISTDFYDKEYFLANNKHLFDIRKQFDEIIYLNKYIEDMREKEKVYLKQLEDLNPRVTQPDDQNSILANKNNILLSRINKIKGSKGWRFLQKLYTVKNRLIP
jgi:glycosyltransferase involved in cell wall biosynthesis